MIRDRRAHHGAQETHVAVVWRALAPSCTACAQKLKLSKRLVIVWVRCLECEVADRGLHWVLLFLMLIGLCNDLMIDCIHELDN